MTFSLQTTFIAIVCLLPTILAAGFKNLVTFGDSYTDIINVGDGGTAWPVYATEYANASLFPFAKSGATCSNDITPRPFPPVFGSQLPMYFAETSNGTVKVEATETLYSLWIGTNDLGVSALLTENEASLVQVTECMVNWVKVLYESGARNFLFQNMIPLQLTVLYRDVSYPNKFWTYEHNSTEWSLFMTELVLSGNKLTQLMLQAMAPTLPGAHIALFDSHSLFQDMYNNPAEYLNGTVSLNVETPINSCIFAIGGTVGNCTLVPDGPERDSYLWYDELHPSEQADRIVAKQIADILEGKNNKWTTWIS